MTFKFQKRRGIGNVITTLIILIASVVLGAGVIFFGGSMFQTNTQSESIKVSNVHSWVNSTDATTAFVVQNTGSKAITINSINFRGIGVPLGMWSSAVADSTVPADLTATQTELTPTTPTMSDGFTDDQAISLGQGQVAVVYLNGAAGSGPGNISSLDAGNTYSLQITAGQANAVQQVQVVTN
jgi:hypothetical protein